MNWSEMKSRVEQQMNHDPQRATLAKKAISSVEEGLSYLAQVGFQFELAPRGKLAALTAETTAGTKTLSIAEGQAIVAPAAIAADNRFQAKENAA